MRKRRLVCLCGILTFCLSTATTVAATRTQVFEPLGSVNLQIRHFPLDVRNNSGGTYHFHLSVLGVAQEDFLPLLAIGVEPLWDGENWWMAVWNLSEESPGWAQRLKALVPWNWGPRNGEAEGRSGSLENLPEPYLAVDHGTGRSRRHFAWATARKTARFLDLLTPFQFALRSYSRQRDDFEERRFHQVYTLLRLYEEVARLDPSPRHLSSSAMVDLKYSLLLNRKAFGIVMDDEPDYSLVESYESHLREQVGKVASTLHTAANLYSLGFQEIAYGFPGRPPITRAAVLSIRQADLPDTVPRWPAVNSFDLGYNPYEHPYVRSLLESHPEEHVPLAFYVLASDYGLKPVIVADFFSPGNVGRRKSTGVARSALEHFLASQKIPLLYRAISKVATHSIDKKDLTHFSGRSAAAGVESTRIFAWMDWSFDSDTNHMLLRALEYRGTNPMANGLDKDGRYARLRLNRLAIEGREEVALYFRTIFEDRLREELGLGGRAVFAQDLRNYRRHLRVQHALDVVRRFSKEVHLSGQSWGTVVAACHDLQALGEWERPEYARFLERLRSLYPEAIPEEHIAGVAALLQVPAPPQEAGSPFTPGYGEPGAVATGGR